MKNSVHLIKIHAAYRLYTAPFDALILTANAADCALHAARIVTGAPDGFLPGQLTSHRRRKLQNPCNAVAGRAHPLQRG